MIRKLFVIMLAVFLLPAEASVARTLKYTDHEPLGGMRTKFIKDVFFAAIEKESARRLTIDDHWNGELSTSYNALRAVGARSADVAIVVPEYFPDNLPLHQIFKSFPLGPIEENQVKFFRRVYEEIPAFPDELRKENVINIFFGTGFPVAFFSTKPLEKLEDVKGGKWRSASFWHKDFLQNAGAVSITMPWGQGIFKALKDGEIDGLMVNVDSGYDLKVHEVAPNVLVSKELWLGHVYLLVMNKNTWNELAKEDKEAIERAAETAYKALGSVMKIGFDAQLEELKKSNANVRILEPKELSRWETAVKYREVQAAWVKEQENKGIKDAGAVMEKIRVIINEP